MSFQLFINIRSKNKYQFSLNLEHEKINNFGFKENNISTRFLWLGYSFIIK